MKRSKGVKVIRRGVVLESELPKELTRRGPKWAKSWPRVRLIREERPAGRPPTKPED
jgi:hypothetical protein